MLRRVFIIYCVWRVIVCCAFLCSIHAKVAARVVIIYVCTVARVSPLHSKSRRQYKVGIRGGVEHWAVLARVFIRTGYCIDTDTRDYPVSKMNYTGVRYWSRYWSTPRVSQSCEHWRNTTHVPSRTLARTPVQTLVLPGVDRETDLRQVPNTAAAMAESVVVGS